MWNKRKNKTERYSAQLVVERRESWLWALAVTISVLLLVALWSFTPLLRQQHDFAFAFNFEGAFRGLVAVVLLFHLYTVYQRVQLHRIRTQLIHQQELFQLITENAADMIAVVDTQGARLYNSPSYERILGFSPEELQKSSAFEQIHPDDRDRVREAAEHARREGMGTRLEYRMQHKDGNWRVLESTASPICDEKGDVERIVIVNRDITERKRAEEALRISEAEYRSTVEGAPFGIFRCTSEGVLLAVNTTLLTMLGYNGKSELVSRNVCDLFSDRSTSAELASKISAAERFAGIENQWARKDGSRLTVRFSGHGSAESREVFVENITEWRLLERQLHQSQKMEAVGRLAGGVAHDFNNVLGVIIGYSEILEDKLCDDPSLEKCVEQIKAAGQRAAGLTRQLLAFSRKQVMELRVLDVNTIIGDMEKMLRRLIGEDIDFRTSLSPDVGHIKADPSQLEQVILNLAVNSRDALPQGGTILIETSNAEMDATFVAQHPGSRPGLYLCLAVSDTGVGMDVETQAHIFEPFFTTKPRGQGTGLGLSTVYGVVKQSGGYITVYSEPGRGTTFKIYLPRAEAEVASPTTRELPAAVEHSTGTVLLVEDEEPFRLLIRQLLQQTGYVVLDAANGADALQTIEHCHNGTIDLLLTDVIMPGMDGRALAERIGQRYPNIKTVYMSGYTDGALAAHNVLEPGVVLIQKPFTRATLLTKISEVLKPEHVS